jgi:hypothetical protein
MNASRGPESMENSRSALRWRLEVEHLQTQYEEVAWFLWLGVEPRDRAKSIAVHVICRGNPYRKTKIQ